MDFEKIHVERIRKFILNLKRLVYTDRIPMRAEFVYDRHDPIPWADLGGLEFRPISPGEIWGESWGSAWFRFTAHMPAAVQGREIGAWIDTDSEACVWRDGSPLLGLTNKEDSTHSSGKHYIPLDREVAAGEMVELLVEAAANELFGNGKQDYRLVEASLVQFDEALFKLVMRLGVLFNLALSLQEGSVRRQKLLFGLNEVCNVWREGSGRDQALDILNALCARPANASALTAYSVGHAHIDLAWLWPVRETKRKGGRTFSTAIRMIEHYPEYVFGASQAQLYKWIRDLYPKLYEEIRQAVRSGRWEVQGAGWVEFDTNLIGGESTIRQMFYGKRFFQREFGLSPDVLWQPDCFGFNANLPQLMRGCGVKYFLTQKLSWNESDIFPHHHFIWRGIDGSEVLAHQQPTNDYCFSNNPKDFLDTERRFAQSEAFDEFLNLYGIGDGGGGPGREHIEYGLCQQDLEGVPKFRFSPAQPFFEKMAAYDRKLYPVWSGELYLQYHRGTYTTQALMKKNNRISEALLHDAELLAALTQKGYPDALAPVWEDVMLMQFHDIIPGTSISWVYQDAREMSAKNHAVLEAFIRARMRMLAGEEEAGPDAPQALLVFNSQSWDRQEGVRVRVGGKPVWIKAEVPACGYSVVSLPAGQGQEPLPFGGVLENEYLRVTLSGQGTILGIYDKEASREVLSSASNVLKLWEDRPNKWSWDINHFYRETEPQLPGGVTLLADRSFVIPGVVSVAAFRIGIGNSTINQEIELVEGERFLRFRHDVDWQERKKMLRVHFYPGIHAHEATYEIQFGAVKRPTRHNTSWEKALFEVPAQRFADLSEPDYGAALINDCKYGYRIVGNEMELNLLRSPTDMDPEADIHSHTYGYLFYPHRGCYEQSDVVKVAHCFNSRMQVLPVSAGRAGESGSFFSVTGDGVKLETVKPCETEPGIILRLYECTGSRASVRIRTSLPFRSAQYCTMTEEPLAGSDPLVLEEIPDARLIGLSFKPFEIRTILLKE
jgi:alpha-mannosidase